MHILITIIFVKGFYNKKQNEYGFMKSRTIEKKSFFSTNNRRVCFLLNKIDLKI